MIGLQIELSDNWKESWDFLITLKFLYDMSDKVRKIHRKNLKIVDFCGNFHRYNAKHTNTTRK